MGTRVKCGRAGLKIGPPFVKLYMYEEIYDFKNLLSAYQAARKCKRYKRNIVGYGFFLESNLFKLQRELVSESYTPSPYACFTVYDPKTRKVAAPAFRDRVLQHSLVSQIEPLFERTFIYDSYACRKNKGTHLGLKRIKKFLQAVRSKYGKNKPFYCLRMDIEKYFASISWDVLLSITSKIITCPKTNTLIQKLVTTHKCLDTYNRIIPLPQDVIKQETRQGVPIGNLTSQLFANIYLNELDHFAKEKLRLKWYARYMDDFLVIHPDKTYLKQVRKDLEIFLDDKLHLHLHPKKVIIQNVKSGIPFVGYLIFYDHVLIRGKTLLRTRRQLKAKKAIYTKRGEDRKLLAIYSSIRGHLKHANTYNLEKNLFKNDQPPESRKKSVYGQLKLFTFMAVILMITCISW
ncbi:TPA: RNA-dependent DNA polymerase [candidate division WWE3 bacterium]|uniref:RNA-directed DNA polymerase (Reverse transcriptase) n=2 Tax=Katanobacteria TaxID=422282 RepID=A0A0G1KIZ5_UNCKA|nr:MAG: RNA-directed DNA polymerase (Reverse transcriptase) [candidate division WWE3 bacterium GW2011_GWC2_44_9]HAZ29462.1 RNA-dependent DNA polymerase [candidate division WWE3 bacterium]